MPLPELCDIHAVSLQEGYSTEVTVEMLFLT